MAKTTQREKSGPMHDYGLTFTLAGLFIASWLAQGIFQWAEELQVSLQHGEELTFLGFLPAFLSATFENWQSEFLQLLTFVVLTATLYHKGSHESKDTDEEMSESLHRIERRLEAIGGKLNDATDEEEHRKMEDNIQEQRQRRLAK